MLTLDSFWNRGRGPKARKGDMYQIKQVINLTGHYTWKVSEAIPWLSAEEFQGS